MDRCDTYRQAQITELVDEEKQINIDDLKIDVNNFLWKILPGKTTLDEAEALSIGVYLVLLLAGDSRLCTHDIEVKFREREN